MTFRPIDRWPGEQKRLRDRAKGRKEGAGYAAMRERASETLEDVFTALKDDLLDRYEAGDLDSTETYCGWRKSWIERLRHADGTKPWWLEEKGLRSAQAMQVQVTELLRILDLGDHARPESPAAVVEREIIPALDRLTQCAHKAQARAWELEAEREEAEKLSAQ